MQDIISKVNGARLCLSFEGRMRIFKRLEFFSLQQFGKLSVFIMSWLMYVLMIYRLSNPSHG